MRYTLEVDNSGAVLITSPQYADYLASYGGEGMAEKIIKANEWNQISEWSYSDRLDGSIMMACLIETPYPYTFEMETWDVG